MVRNIVRDMYDNTDRTGILIIKGWNVEPEETFSNPRFYRCRMNWNAEKAMAVAEEAESILDSLVDIGRFCIGSVTDFSKKTDPGVYFDRDYAEKLNDVWELFFGGYDCDSADRDTLSRLAEERLGGKVSAYNTFVFARRLVKLIKLNAPDVILENGKYEFVRSLVLTFACEEMVCVDISKASFNSRTVMLGEFDESDIQSVFELLESDCSVMPEERTGYTLLVNNIIGDTRLDLYKRYEALKPVVDSMLGTLADTERRIIEKLYGLTDGIRRSYDTTALEMHIPVPVVEGYEEKAMRKLRHPSRAEKLNELLCEEDDSGTGMTELEAFQADLRLADYMARAENGELTDEEQETHDAVMEFIYSPVPDGLKDILR